MKNKYQQYYNALCGKEFNSFISKYSITLNSVRTELSSMESIISSSWDEQGIEYIKNNILPSLKSEEVGIEQSIAILSTAVSKVSNLISKLEELNDNCNLYNNCEEEEKSEYSSKIDNLENEIDGIINEINGMSLECIDSSLSQGGATFSLNTLNDISLKKQEFIGNIDDSSNFYVDLMYQNRMKELVCFDNTTGEIIKEGDTIELEKGETRVLTVRLPYNAGQIDEIVKTSTDYDNSYENSNIVTLRNDINNNPNVVDYTNHENEENPNLHTNYYDWVITANEEGEITISQTCEYKNTDGEIPKAMIDLKINVKSN